MPGPHQNLFVSNGFDKSFDDISTFGLLAYLAYEKEEVALTAAMASWLGYQTLFFVDVYDAVVPRVLFGIDGDGIIVSVEGTRNTNQVIFYTGVSEMIPAVGIDGDSWVHNGFYSLLQACNLIVNNQIAHVPATVPIAFTGHSLGGAIAQLLAVWHKKNTNRTVANCVTFAAPGIGSQGLVDLAESIPVVNIRRLGDLIPLMPPHVQFSNIGQPLTIAAAGVGRYYGVPKKELVFDNERNFIPRGRDASDGFFFQAARGVLDLTGVVPSSPAYDKINEAHSVNEYVLDVMFWRRGIGAPTQDQLKQDAFRRALKAGWAPMPQNQLVDAAFIRQLMANAGVTPPPPPAPAPLPAPVYNQITTGSHVILGANSPRTQFSNGPIWQPVGMAAAVGPTNPAIFGQKQRPFWWFHGPDRLLLEKLREVLNSIQQRDNRLYAQKEGSGLSNNEPIIDRDNDELVDAVNALSERVDLLLSFRHREA